MGKPVIDPTRATGTQSIERAVRVLRELATRGRFGWGLTDLAARCELDHSTTHRILAGLVRERMVSRRSSDRHYLVGPLVFELSLSMPDYAQFQHAAREPVVRLANRFHAMAVLSLRSGADTVCVALHGQVAYAGTAFEVGARRPLGLSAAGVAILSVLDEQVRAAILQQNMPHIRRMGGATLQHVQAMVKRSQKLGYAFNEGDITPGVHALGMPFRGPLGDILGSLALASRAENLPPARAAEVVAALRVEVSALEAEVARLYTYG